MCRRSLWNKKILKHTEHQYSILIKGEYQNTKIFICNIVSTYFSLEFLQKLTRFYPHLENFTNRNKKTSQKHDSHTHLFT